VRRRLKEIGRVPHVLLALHLSSICVVSFPFAGNRYRVAGFNPVSPDSTPCRRIQPDGHLVAMRIVYSGHFAHSTRCVYRRRMSGGMRPSRSGVRRHCSCSHWRGPVNQKSDREDRRTSAALPPAPSGRSPSMAPAGIAFILPCVESVGAESSSH